MTQTFIVTGGNTGLGLQCASALAANHGNVVVIACRDVKAAEPAAQKLRQGGGKVEVLPLDLSRQSSVHAFVDGFRARSLPPLAGIVCNAGGQSIAAPHGPRKGMRRPSASTTWATICSGAQ